MDEQDLLREFIVELKADRDAAKAKEKRDSWTTTAGVSLVFIAVLAAVATQWGLEESGLLLAMMVTTTAWLGAAILIAAGLWQITPIKHACLRQCRSPVSFLATYWRVGRGGAFRMGLTHGAYCLGCCWILMALLFFGGVMNLWWVGGLAACVLLEKTLPIGHWLAYAVGGALVVWGVCLVASV